MVFLQFKDDVEVLYEYVIVKIFFDYFFCFIKLFFLENCYDLIILDDIVRYSVLWMFLGYDIEDIYFIKLICDVELYIDDEFVGDFI